MLALDKNLIMTGDLVRSIMTDNQGSVHLKRNSLVLDPDRAPMKMKCVIDNRVIGSTDMTATVEFEMNFLIIKDESEEDAKHNCSLRITTPEDPTKLSVNVELINWRGGIPVLNMPTPVLVSRMMPLFNLLNNGKVFFCLTIRACDTSNVLFVDVDFWYTDTIDQNPSTEEKSKEVKDEESQGETALVEEK